MDKKTTDMIDMLFEGAYIVDKERKILYWNNGAERITGYSQNEVVNFFCFTNILRHVDDIGNELCFNGCPLHHTLETGEEIENRVYLHHKEGHRVPVIVRTSPLYNDDGEIYGALELFTDAGYHKKLFTENKRLQELSIKDQLTNIYNRSYINYQVDALINEYELFSNSFGVVFVDIDNFKYINDTYGHKVGDDILKLISRTIKSNIRDEDLFGRYGGEEFLLVFKLANKEELLMISEKIRLLVEKSSIIYNNDSISVTISLGASMYREGDTKEELIDRADQAMYESKRTGKNKVSLSKGE